MEHWLPRRPAVAAHRFHGREREWRSRMHVFDVAPANTQGNFLLFIQPERTMRVNVRTWGRKEGRVHLIKKGRRRFFDWGPEGKRRWNRRRSGTEKIRECVIATRRHGDGGGGREEGWCGRGDRCKCRVHIEVDLGSGGDGRLRPDCVVQIPGRSRKRSGCGYDVVSVRRIFFVFRGTHRRRIKIPRRCRDVAIFKRQPIVRRSRRRCQSCEPQRGGGWVPSLFRGWPPARGGGHRRAAIASGAPIQGGTTARRRGHIR